VNTPDVTHLSYDLPVRLSDRCAEEQSREWCISPWCIPDIVSSWCWYWYHCHNRSINHLFPEPNISRKTKKNIKKSKLLQKCLENKNATKKDNSTYNCPKENTNTTPVQYRQAENPMVLAQLQSLDNEYQLSLTEHVSTIDMAWQNFWSPKFRKKIRNEVLLFLVIPKFPFNCKICRRKLSCQ